MLKPMRRLGTDFNFMSHHFLSSATKIVAKIVRVNTCGGRGMFRGRIGEGVGMGVESRNRGTGRV